jgi:membrane protease YdiL (CAAX protease family)
VRQLLDPEPGETLSPGELRGFGVVPWGWRDMGLIGAVAIIGQALLVPVGITGFTRPITGYVSDASLTFFTQVLLLYGLVFATIWAVGIRRHGADLSTLGFRPVDIRSLGALLGLVAAVVLGANIVVRAFVHLPRTQDLFVFGHNPRQVLLIVALVLVAAPLSEEVLFRGFLLQGLARRWGFWPAAVVSSAVFALAHLWPYLYVPIFIMGLAFAWLFWRTGSLWASIAAHATMNATSLVVTGLFYRN